MPCHRLVMTRRHRPDVLIIAGVTVLCKRCQTEETLRNKEAGMHAKRELYLWMVLVRVVVGGASNLFVPPMCNISAVDRCYYQGNYKAGGKRILHSTAQSRAKLVAGALSLSFIIQFSP